MSRRLPGSTFLATAGSIGRQTAAPADAARVWATCVWLRIKHLARRRGGRTYRLPLTIAGATRPIRVSEYTDLYVVREIVCDGDYRLDAGFAPRRILDLGSNIGVSVAYFRASYPEAVVHAVEVNRAALRVLRENVAGDERVVIHELAVAGTDGEREFVESAQTWKSSLWEPGTPPGDTRRVKALSLTSLLSTIAWDAVDLIKIDIEGGEWETLRAGDLSVCKGWLVGELHDLEAHGKDELARTFRGFELQIDPDGTFRARRLDQNG